MWRASQPPARGWTNAELVFTLRTLWMLVLSVQPPVPSHPLAKPRLLSPSSLSPRSLGLDNPRFLESALPWPLPSLSSLHLPSAIVSWPISQPPVSPTPSALCPSPYWDSKNFPQNCSGSPYRTKEETQWGPRPFYHIQPHTSISATFFCTDFQPHCDRVYPGWKVGRRVIWL